MKRWLAPLFLAHLGAPLAVGQPADAVVEGISNAWAKSLGGCSMLAGIDFPSVGCWRITLGYLGQSLSFVVETYDRTRERSVS